MRLLYVSDNPAVMPLKSTTPAAAATPTPAAKPFDLEKLQDAIEMVADLAKQLTADKNHGRSPIAANLRSALDHANELATVHEQWMAANPVQAPAVK